MINEHLKPLSAAGRENWDRIFGKKEEPSGNFYYFEECDKCFRTTEVTKERRLNSFMERCAHCGEPVLFRRKPIHPADEF